MREVGGRREESAWKNTKGAPLGGHSANRADKTSR